MKMLTWGCLLIIAMYIHTGESGDCTTYLHSGKRMDLRQWTIQPFTLKDFEWPLRIIPLVLKILQRSNDKTAMPLSGPRVQPVGDPCGSP
ncbi:hypothetical protein EDC04DRAFT_853004 [Pisolithus marmoratus]|nr:hypothetical protein EDC04DRAFT_853004 [Pisolithus marmoratus]